MPLMLEMMTGQKMPQMGGTIAEIQQGITQIQMTLGQIIQNQTQLDQRLTALETNASQQFTNLVQEVKGIKSIRLTHDRERKQIELHGNASDFDKSRHYNLQQEN
jgi:TolA-binding protein